MKKLFRLSLITIALIVSSQRAHSQKNDAVKEGLEIGNRAPELVMKNYEGKDITLSSLRGQTVLLDFWASWCTPCRHENRNITATHDLYKTASLKSGKGFTIFSVSLDMDAQKWKKAITEDNLAWVNHVCDFKHWGSPAAQLYGIQSIPANYLLDGNGIILAKNLRGPALAAKLEELNVKQ